MIPSKTHRLLLPVFLLGMLLNPAVAQQAEPQEVSDPKGAIIIASLEGQVTVTNNTTGQALPAAQVAVGKLLFDGHTVNTAKGAKVVLLFSTGTITTLKEESALNIKKFTQAKFDPKASGRLSDRDDEPSPSDTLIDLSVGDMVVDVKKLKKESSFNIDSPVGTAGIRGTIINQVVQGDAFKFNQITGSAAFTPKGGGPAQLLRPGQSLAGNFGAGGLLGALQLGQVPRGILNTIKTEAKESASAADKSTGGDGAVGTPDQEKQPQGEEDDEAPSEEEINESDDERGASAKGVDDNGTEAVALSKAGLIDLNDPEQLEKVETYVEVTDFAADEKARKDKDRRNGNEKDSEEFVKDLVAGLDDVVVITEKAESAGAKDAGTLGAVLENADKADDLKEVVIASEEVGVNNKDALGPVLLNADKAEELKTVVEAASDVGSKDKDTLGAVFRNADQAKEVAAVVEEAKTADAPTQTEGEAKTVPAEGAAEPVVEKKKKKLGALFKVVKKVDEVKVKAKKAAAEEPVAADPGATTPDPGAETPAAPADVADAVGSKDVNTFATDIFTQLGDVVSLTETATDVGSEDGFDEVLKNADKAVELVEVVSAAEDADKSALGAVLKSAENAVELQAVVEQAKAIETADTTDNDTQKKEKKEQKLGALFKVVKKVDEVKEAAKKAATTPDPTPGVDPVDEPAVKVADVFSNLESVVDLTETATDIGDVDGEAGFAAVLENADQADKLVEIVKAAETLVAEGTDKKATLGAVLKSADQAEKLATVAGVGKTEKQAKQEAKKAAEDAARAAGKTEKEIAAAGEAARRQDVEAEKLTASTDKLSALFKVITKVDAVEVAAEKDPTTAPVAGEKTVEDFSKHIFAELENVVTLTETATREVAAEELEAGFDAVLANADKASDLVEVVSAAENIGAKDSLGAVFKSADQADKLKAVVEQAETISKPAEGDTAKKAKLNALFDVVKKVDVVKTSADAAGAVKVDDVFANIDAVVELAETATDAATSEGGVEDADAKAAFLDNVFKVADKAQELKAVVQAAASAQGDAADDQAKADNAKALGSILTLATDETRVTALASVAGVKKEDGVVKAGTADSSKLTALLDVVEKVDAAADAGSTDISADAVFTNIDLVVDLAEETAVVGTDTDRTAALDAVLKTAKNDNAAEVLKAAKDVAEKVKAAGGDNKDGNLANVLKNADKAVELNTVVNKAGDTDLNEVFANAEQAVELASLVNDAGSSADDIRVVLENAGKAKSLHTVVERAKLDAKDRVERGVQGATADVAGLLKQAGNADKLKTVVDQIDSLGFEGDQASNVFANLDKVADVLDKVTLEGEAVDADVAKNLLGNANDAEEIGKAVDIATKAAKVSGNDFKVAAFVQEDVKKLKAYNNIATSLQEAGEDSLSSDALAALGSIDIDDAAQYEDSFTDKDNGEAFREQILEKVKEASPGDDGGIVIDVKGEVQDAVLVKFSEHKHKDKITSTNAADVAFVLEHIEGNSAQEEAFFANIDKLEDIMALGLKYGDETSVEGKKSKMDVVFENLDRVSELRELADELDVYPEREELVFANADKADAILSTFKDIEKLDEEQRKSWTKDLFDPEKLDNTMKEQGKLKLSLEFPDYGDAIQKHGDKAAEIAATAERFKGDKEKLDKLFDNLDSLDKINDLAARFDGDADKGKLDKVFENIDKIDQIADLSDRLEKDNLGSIEDKLFDNLDKLDELTALADDFKQDPARLKGVFERAGEADELLKLKREAEEAGGSGADVLDNYEDLKGALAATGGDSEKRKTALQNADKAKDFKDDPGKFDLTEEDRKRALDAGVSSDLLKELKDLGLTGDELDKVLADLDKGPGEDTEAGDLPTNKPSDQQLNQQADVVSLLGSHVIEGSVDPSLVLSYQQASASDFFKDVVEVFDAFGTPPEGQERPPLKVLGGKSVTVNAGSYDLSGVFGSVDHKGFIFAAADKLTIAGNVAFRNENEAFDSSWEIQDESLKHHGAWEGVILLSAGSISLPQGTAEQRASLSYGGNYIEVSSLDTLEVINVDLSAEDIVAVRSLDSLVINNAKMITSSSNGGGPDRVHLRALEDINANNLLFSENMKRIAMEAMTINLSNVAFPNGSQVHLGSLYGGVDGKYPTFGSLNKQYGRVNFIENIRYGTNLLNSRAAFDQHGSAINIFAK